MLRCGPEWRRLALSWQPEVPSPRYGPTLSMNSLTARISDSRVLRIVTEESLPRIGDIATSIAFGAAYRGSTPEVSVKIIAV